MARVRSDNDARYALRASFVDANGDVITGDTITIDSGVSAGQIANWDTAYGWGDHASAGYLTSYTEVDTLDSVTGRGATTTNAVTVGNITSGSVTAGGDITTTSSQVIAGFGSSGPMAMSINDGGGNASLTFNHYNNTAQTVGANTGRITHNSDATSNSSLQFKVGDAGASPSNMFEIRTSYAICYATSSTAFRCNGDIVAYYSDRRLKDVSGAIESPLEKISALHGVYYTHNDKARELGYEGSERQVGLLAQDVQAVLPEVIQRAPIDMDPDGGSLSGEDYITVNYQRIVPLLVEGIKALTTEVAELKEKLNAL